MIKNFRNLSALLLAIIVFPTLWALHAMGIMALPEIVLGATIALETLIVQFYFRKKIEGE